MAGRVAPYIDNTGLVFAYDQSNTVRSYLGEPTTNFAYLHNGRKDSSYTSYMPESGTGQIAALHPGAIQVYNQNGSDISYYLNTGINIANSGVDWYDTNHAYWVYDEVLKKPVVQMIDRNGVWQAKYMGLGLNWTDMGLTAGDQYTISWLQWSSDGVKRAHAGLYWHDTTAGYSNFWDGLSDTGNTIPQTWTRVSQTFTLSSGRSLDQGLTWYMYGMYYSRATLRIADVQLEKKSHRTQFSFANTRSATQGLKDLTGRSTIDLSNVSFDSSAQMTFDGTDDYIALPTGLLDGTGDFTVEAVVQADATEIGGTVFGNYPSGELQVFFGSRFIGMYLANASTYLGTSPWSTTLPEFTTNTVHILTLRSGTTTYFYINGELKKTGSSSSSVGSTSAVFRAGTNTSTSEQFTGDIHLLRVYNRALTASEIQQNFNAVRGRYGI